MKHSRFLVYICNRASENTHDQKVAKFEFIEALQKKATESPSLFSSEWREALEKLVGEGAFFVEAGVHVALEQGQ